MKKIFTWIIILLVVVGGVAGFLWLRNRQAASQEAAPDVLRTEQVERGDLEITVAASGNVAVKEQLALQFDATGTVAHVAVEVNDRVQGGDVLASLDTVDLERAVRQAELALEQAQLNLSILQKPPAEADLEVARLSVQSAAQALEVARIGKQTALADANQLRVDAQRAREQAHIDYQDAEGSAREDAHTAYQRSEEQEYIAGLNAETTVEQAQSQWLAAYNQYQQAVQALESLEQGPDEQQIRQSELQVEQAQLNLDQAEADLEDATLRAPFDGLVVTVNAQEGLPAPAGQPAFVLVDDDAYYIEVAIDEMDISRVAVEQAVAITLDAYPDVELRGEIESVAPAPTMLGGIISYLVRVRIIEAGDVLVQEGMTANVTVLTATIEDILLVPNWAIRTEQDGAEIRFYCYRLDAGVPQRVDITLGRRGDAYTEVLSGLDAGDTVALVTEERGTFPLFADED